MCRPTTSLNSSEDVAVPSPSLFRSDSVDSGGIGLTKLYTMNVHGMTEDKERELVQYMVKVKADIICLQETHLYGSGSKILIDVEGREFNFIWHGPARPDGVTRKKPPNNGVGLLLSPKASELWDGKVRKYGLRLLALRFETGSYSSVVASGYAPHSGYPAAERHEFQDAILDLEANTRRTDKLMIGMDANATVGRKTNSDGVLGRFGRKRQSVGGKELVNTLAAANMIVLNTFFRKSKRKGYGTWRHPKSKEWFTLDVWVGRAEDRRDALDCGVRQRCVTTDHRSVVLRLRPVHQMGNPGRHNRTTRTRTDRSLLQKEEKCKKYQDAFKEAAALSHEGETPYKTWIRCLGVADEVITVQTRPRQDWFTQSSTKIETAISSRTGAQSRYDDLDKDDPSAPAAHEALRRARSKLKSVKAEAQADWIDSVVGTMGDTVNNPRAVWDACAKLRAGLGLPTGTKMPLLKKVDGTFCKSSQENADRLKEHFGPLYDHDTQVGDVLGEAWSATAAQQNDPAWEKPPGLQQYSVMEETASTPTQEEVARHVKKMKWGKAAGKDGCSTDHMKALSGLAEADAILLAMVVDFWEHKRVDVDWLTSLLRLLPKGGALTDVNRWRGICLIQVCVKLIRSILAERLQMVLAVVGLKSQQGFMPKRGCADGIWNMKMALSLRREFGKETFAAFIDLVKAFDTVVRALLWKILARYGVPDHVIELLRVLCDGTKVELAVGTEKVVMDNTVGVLQGSNDGPVGFLFVVQAVFETMVWPEGCEPVFFKTSLDGLVHSRKMPAHEASGNISFSLREGLFADDAQILFSSHAAMEAGISAFVEHAARFGLECHYAPEDTPWDKLEATSKSQCVWFPSYNTHIAAAPTPSPIVIAGFTVGTRVFPAGSMPFVRKFKYLGTVVNQALTDVDDVEGRVKSGAQSFGALRCVHDLPRVCLGTKLKLFIATSKMLTLYGSENWSSLASLERKLEVFQNRCVRVMLGVSRWEQRKQRLTTAALNSRIGILPVAAAVDQRALRWLGHVQRMPDDNVAKMLLYAWVPDCKRKRGGQEKRFGRRAQQLLLDMALLLPAALSKKMSQELAGQSVSSTRSRRRPVVEKKWRATPTFETEWLKCSTWMVLAEDRDLWKEAVDTYIERKYGSV